MTMFQRFAFVKGFLTDESGISSVEYALLLGFVAAGIIVGADLLSTAVSDKMTNCADVVTNGTASTANC